MATEINKDDPGGRQAASRCSASRGSSSWRAQVTENPALGRSQPSRLTDETFPVAVTGDRVSWVARPLGRLSVMASSAIVVSV